MTATLPAPPKSSRPHTVPSFHVVVSIAIHVIIWVLVPYTVLGNLFTDTAEMVYWGLDPHWTYPKHPPLPSILTALLIRAVGQPFFLLILLGQVCVLVTASYVWLAVSRHADRHMAVLAVLLLLASPSATIYALQVNHNTMLMPIVAGVVYHALCFAQGGRLRHALGLGLLAGLGLLTKYVMAAIILPVLIVAIARAPLRRRVISAETLAALTLCGLIVLPHLAALLDGQAGSVARATNGSQIATMSDAFDSAGNLFTAFAMVLLIPMIGLKYGLKVDLGVLRRPASDQERLALAGALGPLVVMMLGAIVTGQKIKPQWSVAFMPAICIWLGMAISRATIAGDDRPTQHGMIRSATRFALGFSTLGLVGFIIYLGVGVALGLPRWAWLADAAQLERQIQTIWPMERGKLQAVLIDQRGVTGFAGLMHPDLPHIVEIRPSISAWTDQAWLSRTGGVAILSTDMDLRTPIAGLCAVVVQRYDIPSRWGRATYPVRLAVMEPSKAPSDVCPEKISSSTR